MNYSTYDPGRRGFSKQDFAGVWPNIYTGNAYGSYTVRTASAKWTSVPVANMTSDNFRHDDTAASDALNLSFFLDSGTSKTAMVSEVTTLFYLTTIPAFSQYEGLRTDAHKFLVNRVYADGSGKGVNEWDRFVVGGVANVFGKTSTGSNTGFGSGGAVWLEGFDKR
jgi:hypothetical protein